MTHALFPVDGSPLSLSAAEALVRVSGPETDVLVVTVTDTVDRVRQRLGSAASALSGADFSEGALQRALAEQEAAARTHLDRASERLAGLGVTSIDTEILRGEPGRAIVRAALEHECDVIVMATHGRTGWRRTVLGSVTDYVLRNSPGVSVLVHADSP